MKYVDEKGLEYFYEKIKDKLNEIDQLSEEIADLKGAEIPDYWKTHLAEKIETIKALHIKTLNTLNESR